jgi:hypothetical protein
MKKLFDFQYQQLNGKFGKWSQRNFKTQLQWVIDHWQQAVWGPDHQMVYNHENMIKNAHAYGLLPDTVAEWINDEEFSQYQKLVFCINKLMPENQMMINIIASVLELESDKIDIRLQMQPPGGMLPMHLDSPKYHQWNLPSDKEIFIEKYAIFLEDQSLGQTWLMNTDYLSWQQGDVVKFEQSTIPHGTANFGYRPRPIITVVGLSVHHSDS